MFGHTLAELPRYILMDILLMLSLNILLVCRCVCTTWRNLISDREFAKQHFANSEVYALVRSVSSSTNVSRALYLVEPEYSCTSKTNSGSCQCDRSWLSFSDGFHLKRKLRIKFKIPLRNSGLVIDDEDATNLDIQSRVGSQQKCCVEVKANDHRFLIANSCRGLLCLAEPFTNDPVSVCNPITGEYINLPALTHSHDECVKSASDCALGFSPQANQYKVVRMFDERLSSESTLEPITGKMISKGRVTEIHTLGTSCWRRIGGAPISFNKLGFPTYLNEAVHWLYLDEKKLDYLISFNFVTDNFKPIPPPPLEHYMFARETIDYISLGELKGRLCMCYQDKGEIVVWVMRDYGVQESWTKEYRVTASTPGGRWLRGLYEPVTVLSNGGLLLFHHLSGTLFYYCAGGARYEAVKICSANLKYEVIAYIPNFISLKDAVVGEDVAVLNINSRCGKLKLPGETKSFFLQGTDPGLDSNFDLSSSDDESDFNPWMSDDGSD